MTNAPTKRSFPKVKGKGRDRLKCREIFVVERRLLMRAAIANWVNRFPDLHVCGEAATRASAVKAIPRLHPDLVLTEILRKQDLGFIRELHHRHPRLPILVFSVQDEARFASRALAVGACGYLMKGVDGPSLVAGIRSALARRGVVGHPNDAARRSFQAMDSLHRAETVAG